MAMTAVELVDSKAFRQLLAFTSQQDLVSLTDDKITLLGPGEVIVTTESHDGLQGTFALRAFVFFGANRVFGKLPGADVRGKFTLYLPHGFSGDDATAILARATLKLLVEGFPSTPSTR